MKWKWAPNLYVTDYPRAHHHKRRLIWFFLNILDFTEISWNFTLFSVTRSTRLNMMSILDGMLQ